LQVCQRFNQKNHMEFRPTWDPSVRHLLQLNVETQLRHIEQNITGFALKDTALAAGATLVNSFGGTDMNRPNSGLTAWQPLPVYSDLTFPSKKKAINDAHLLTGHIKRVARYYGADLVGIANLNQCWVYSHYYIPETGENNPVEIDERYKYVVVMAIEMDYSMMRAAPSMLEEAETLLTYSKMAFLVGSVAQFIRQLGYSAIPALNDTALSVPLAVDAGLGELGRHGLLITPQFGPRQRICKVITDLPLEPDHPIEFGVTQFCSICRKCARECPGQAISYGQRTTEALSISNNPGVLKWPLSAEKCREYWAKIGTSCGVCIRVCPFNKRKGSIHDMSRWLIKHIPWVDYPLVRIDDFLGYGRYLDPALFWKDKI